MSEMEPEAEGVRALPDLRLPIGLFFTVASIIIIIAGFMGNATANLPAVSQHADRDWGVLLLVFGVLMTFFGWRAGSAAPDETPTAGGRPPMH